MTLLDFFSENKKAAIAFSGGVDSAYLVYEALQSRADISVYYVKSAFQPRFELEDAKRLAGELKFNINIIEADVLSSCKITDNPSDRCYHCKRQIFSAIAKAAHNDGYELLLDGTNASDSEQDRPGMAALREMCVRSPLRECGLTKAEIRRLSRRAGLFTWDKPSYACLATRIKTGEKITAQKLVSVEKSEGFLFSLGFSDFRIRLSDNTAKLQLKEEQLDLLLKNRAKILMELKKYYGSVTLDLEVRQ